MDNDTAVFILFGLKLLAPIAAICAATFLIHKEREGWGWIIFLGAITTLTKLSIGG